MTDDPTQCPQGAFRQSLLAIAGLKENASPKDLAACNREFREALLLFASSGEDNLACLDEISIGTITDRMSDGTIVRGPSWGLRITNSDELGLASLLWRAEGGPIPDAVSQTYPKLTQSQWDATLRLMVLICSALEGTFVSQSQDA